MISIDLSGKTAVVTGGGQGLGRSICGVLHAAGANVVVNYFADAEGANRTRAEAAVGELGERAAAVEALGAQVGRLTPDHRAFEAGLTRLVEEMGQQGTKPADETLVQVNRLLGQNCLPVPPFTCASGTAPPAIPEPSASHPA